MSEGLERTGAEAGGNAEVEALVHRFWLTFIRTLAAPHLAASAQGQTNEILERRFAENIDKAVEAALSDRPPHRCGSFGRAALTLLRGRHGADDGVPWLADGEDPAPAARAVRVDRRLRLSAGPGLTAGLRACVGCRRAPS